MISLEIWRDKLPEDKAKYYNRTRMSLDLFCRRMYLGEMQLVEEMRRGGFVHNPITRKFEPRKRIVWTRNAQRERKHP